MRQFKTKNILSVLLPIFIFSLVLSTGVSVGATKKEAPNKKAAIEQIIIPGSMISLGSDVKEKNYAYAIGGEAARKWRWFDGEIKRDVFVGTFSIDKYPVTQAQYYDFVRATKHRAPYISETDYKKQGFLVHPYSEVRPYLWKRGGKKITDNKKYFGARAHQWESLPPADKLDHPVVLVSVDDAAAYCTWRGGSHNKKTSRLPTEDEWEKAARAFDSRYFPWGNVWDGSRANIGSTGPGGTTSVYKYYYSSSPFGVYEMAGNIFEWTSTSDKKDKSRNILKSCSWDDMPGFCRGAARHSRPKKSRHILIGFRCVSLKK